MFINFVGCTPSEPIENVEIPPSDRVINFSGMEWIVRKSGETREGPGPNFFSDSSDNVWLDSEGRLHLKITQRGGYWYCAGITAKHSLGYGKYVFYVNSDINELDDNVVAGLFTYLNDQEEIDIEFSKWSDVDGVNTQYVVQPGEVSGNRLKFDIPPGVRPAVHSFDWSNDKIVFQTAYVKSNTDKQILESWTYRGEDIPMEGNEKLKMNLWLYKGLVPKNVSEQEIIIDSVRFMLR